MSAYQIGVIVGSLRLESINRKLADALIKLAPSELSFKDIAIDKLPLYNQDDDNNQAASVKAMKAAIRACDGLLFVTPEYNRSLPGVLKNALDHGSRPYGQSAWAGKPAGIVGASLGAMGSALAQQHLRNILSCLNVPVMCQPEVYVHVDQDFFEESGDIDANRRDFFKTWMQAFTQWIEQHAVEKA